MLNVKTILLLAVSAITVVAFAGTKHGATSAHTTINGKILCGYQGWFATPTDGASLSWKHYSINTKSGQLFEPGACSIDMWPDMREYNTNESFQTAFTDPDGTKSRVYSSYKLNTSLLHFRWMEEYGIDGVILQRFVTNIRNSGSLRNFNDTVMMHTMQAAKAYDRAVCIMYDMTSMKSADTTAVKNDWKRLVDTYKLTSGGDDQPYLYHKGKPMICLWGFPGQIVTVIRTDADQKAMGAGSIVLQSISGIRKTKINPIVAYYDKTQHQLVLKTHSEFIHSGILSIYDSTGSELLRKQLKPDFKSIQIPLYLQRGICLVCTSGFNGNFSQKITVN